MALSRAYPTNRLINNPGLSHLRREELSSLWWEVTGGQLMGWSSLAGLFGPLRMIFFKEGDVKMERFT